MKSRLIILALGITLLSSGTSKAEATSFNHYIAANLMRVANLSLHQLYDGLRLADYGLNRQAMNYAVQGYQQLVNRGLVNNSQYLTIVDYSQPSSHKRFYVLDVENKELVTHSYVLHGKNSGSDMAESFSNAIHSNKSSLGFFLTKHTYYGSRGFSLRLAGLEPGINDNVEKRGVVIHGTKYINDERVQQGAIGRSLGCPALPEDVYADVIHTIKDGSVLFVYAPLEGYLSQSFVLSNPVNALIEPGPSFVPAL